MKWNATPFCRSQLLCSYFPRPQNVLFTPRLFNLVSGWKTRMKENWYIILRSSVSGVEFVAESKHPCLAVLCSSPAPKSTLPRGFLVNGGQCKEALRRSPPSSLVLQHLTLEKWAYRTVALYIVLDLNWNWSCDPFALTRWLGGAS